MKIIRWKYFIPVVVIVAALLLFFIVFFDPLAARAIESVGSKVNGAKVEIDGFKTKFFAGRVEIARLQVTDRKAPMQNVIETAGVSFQLSPAEVLKKRFVISDASLHGLQFNTPRKTSGAILKLAKKEEADGPPGPAEKLFDKYKDRFKVSLAGMKTDIKDKITFDPKDTQIVKLSTDLKAKAETLPKDWDAKVKSLDADNRLKAISDQLESIKKTPTNGTEALTAIPASLKKLKEQRDALAKLKSDVQGTKDSVFGDVKNYRAGVASLPDAKKKDVDDLMSRLNLDFANPDKLMEGIIGPLVLQRFQTIMKYVQIARKHMPSKKENESLPPTPRANGMDITFPSPAAPPRFWLMKAALDGVYQNITASGGMTNLTSDPARVGQPFKIKLDGAHLTQKYALDANLDHVTDVPKDSFDVKATGIDLASVVGPDAVSALTGGKAAADVAFSVVGEGALSGQIGVSMTGVKLDREKFAQQIGLNAGDKASTEDALKSSFVANVVQAIEGMPQITLQAQLSGTWSDPSMKLTSNLTDALSGAIKTTFGNAVKEQRAQIEAKLNDVMAKEKAQLDAKGADLEKKVNDRLGGLEAQIDKKISDASGINLSPAGGASPFKIPSLNKLFKK